MTCPGHICETCGNAYKHHKCPDQDAIASCLICSITKPAKCPGHVCKSCEQPYKHEDKQCLHPILDPLGQGAFTGVCPGCNAECKRQDALKEIMSAQHPLTGHEEVTIAIEHESLVWNMCQEDDWEQNVRKHILDMERKVQSFRVKIGIARATRGRKQMEELANFSPEELAAYKKKAATQKTKHKPSTAALGKRRLSKIEKAIASFVKMGIPQDQAEALVKQQSKMGDKS